MNYNITNRLYNKIAVITGGASGIGAATVRRFVQEGASVVVADIQDEAGQALCAELCAQHDKAAVYIHTDVSQEADVKAMIDLVVATYGRVDCLFNNAGYGGVSGNVDEIDMDGFDATIGVLLRGPMLGMKHVAPIMKAQGSGSIINTGSVAGLRSGMGPAVYSAAKAGVIHLSRSIAAELGPHGIRVNSICPGAIPTPIFLGEEGRDLSQEKKDEAMAYLEEAFTQAQPVNRSASPADIAAAAVYLASDDGSFVSGHALVVDGSLIYGNRWSDEENIATRVGEALGVDIKL
ncbi:MAG: glucose 1-dehydrogenase [Chloroflexota bacterium]